MAKRKHRRGRHLEAVTAAELIAYDPDLVRFDAERQAAGFTLQPTVRPYLSVGGLVTLRFVWRKRSEGLTQTLTWTVREPVEGVRR